MLLGQRVVAELGHRLLGEVAELVLGQVLQRGPDHLDVGRQRRQREMREAGKQLAAGKVTGGPEQHDDVGRDDVDPLACGADPGAG